ncbi:hypothetical protein FEM48_Zijuj05G0183300 [Ziziphus jujuba var. spinosa]|uniref:Uncharacterized protein n=1 Tax=Ziziphus jujuba var. spinosa TaxID=714518 RepID=A0A978VGE2_ZIZJJ|nr:hypothetical protein FEM48_Zijuj05G0183300 [Ziziphus jujuba var. spinosa]
MVDLKPGESLAYLIFSDPSGFLTFKCDSCFLDYRCSAKTSREACRILLDSSHQYIPPQTTPLHSLSPTNLNLINPPISLSHSQSHDVHSSSLSCSFEVPCASGPSQSSPATALQERSVSIRDYLSSVSSLQPQCLMPSPPVRTHAMCIRALNNIFKPKVFSDFFFSTKESATTSDEPRTTRQALKIPEWQLAMHAEYDALISKHTWDFVPFSSNQNIIGCNSTIADVAVTYILRFLLKLKFSLPKLPFATRSK